jgi:2-succinyl-5-enolpyruvyl-6-hydroxy-3-cyclohexene-1-carboxylate synthase
VASGAIGGDGYVSAAMGEVGLASGKHAVALLWRVAFAAYDVEAEVKDRGG